MFLTYFKGCALIGEIGELRRLVLLLPVGFRPKVRTGSVNLIHAFVQFFIKKSSAWVVFVKIAYPMSRGRP